MDNIEREVKIKTLEAEIEHLKKERVGLVAKVEAAKKAVERNDQRQEEKRREIIVILKEAR